jgi:hypothetical protein
MIADQHPIDRRTGHIMATPAQLELQSARPPPPVPPAQLADHSLYLARQRRGMTPRAAGAGPPTRPGPPPHSRPPTDARSGGQPNNARLPPPPTPRPALPTPLDTAARPRSAPAYTGVSNINPRRTVAHASAPGIGRRTVASKLSVRLQVLPAAPARPPSPPPPARRCGPEVQLVLGGADRALAARHLR